MRTARTVRREAEKKESKPQRKLALPARGGGAGLQFFRDTYNELKKVVWPTRKETVQTTAAVFAFVVVMAVFLWLSDKTLEWVLYDVVLGWKKG